MPNDPRPDCCETCRFWEGPIVEEEVTFGRCRRHAPVRLAPRDGDENKLPIEWPETAPEEWCGEWQPPPDVRWRAEPKGSAEK